VRFHAIQLERGLWTGPSVLVGCLQDNLIDHKLTLRFFATIDVPSSARPAPISPPARTSLAGDVMLLVVASNEIVTVGDPPKLPVIFTPLPAMPSRTLVVGQFAAILVLVCLLLRKESSGFGPALLDGSNSSSWLRSCSALYNQDMERWRAKACARRNHTSNDLDLDNPKKGRVTWDSWEPETECPREERLALQYWCTALAATWRTASSAASSAWRPTAR
jgi:hypothetical protein